MSRPLIVLKFGGTSVGTVERVHHVAALIREQARNHAVIVVVSAMAGETNRLTTLAHDLSPHPLPEAFDMLLATGEQASCALVSMALQDLGQASRPLLGFQVGIRTESFFSRARIEEIDTALLRSCLEEGSIPVVAGFQGVDASGRITTLGRGGSDTTAVALAVAMKAERCDIYTDVNGVYTADPRLVPKARKLEKLSSQEMMELASLGAKVLHMRSVELASKFHLPLRVLSTFEPSASGTSLYHPTSQELAMLESPVVSAMTSDRHQTVLALELPSSEGARFPARYLKPLAAAKVNVDMISETPATENQSAALTLTMPDAEAERARDVLAAFKPRVILQNGVKISVVGLGMRNHPGVAAKIFETLESHQIPVHVVSTSEITVSFIVDDRHQQTALQQLHRAFELDAPAV